MNRSLLIIGGVVLLIVGVGAYVVAQQRAPEETARTENPGAMMEGEGDHASRYAVYSKSTLENNADKRRVLFFYANWCPICRPADADFKKNASRIPEDVVLIRVNYNDSDTDAEEKALADKYGITYQHTFVQIDSAGNEVTKWTGGRTNELLANIK